MRKTDNGDTYTNSYLVSWNNETIAVELGFVNFQFSSNQINHIIRDVNAGNWVHYGNGWFLKLRVGTKDRRIGAKPPRYVFTVTDTDSDN